MNTDTLTTGLKVSVDWLAFTFKGESITVLDVIKFLGFDDSMFSLAPRGAMGYKSMLNLDGFHLSILYDGREDMGIHVNCSGSAVGYLLSRYASTHCSVNPFDGRDAFMVDELGSTVLTQFLTDVNKHATISRFDIAIDDIGDVHFTLDDVQSYFDQKLVISKFRTVGNQITKSVSSGDMVGGTIYLGSSKSDIRLRIYDKQLEQASKHPDQSMTIPWIRWEFQLRNDRACSAVRLLIESNSLSQVAAGILNNYMRFIVNDDNNRSRCSTDSRWLAFVGTLEKSPLYVHAEAKTIEDKKNWIIEQVLPTLTGIIIADGGSYDIITNHWESSLFRMKHDMKELISDYLYS